MDGWIDGWIDNNAYDVLSDETQRERCAAMYIDRSIDR